MKHLIATAFIIKLVTSDALAIPIINFEDLGQVPSGITRVVEIMPEETYQIFGQSNSGNSSLVTIDFKEKTIIQHRPFYNWHQLKARLASAGVTFVSYWDIPSDIAPSVDTFHSSLKKFIAQTSSWNDSEGHAVVHPKYYEDPLFSEGPSGRITSRARLNSTARLTAIYAGLFAFDYFVFHKGSASTFTALGELGIGVTLGLFSVILFKPFKASTVSDVVTVLGGLCAATLLRL